MKDCVDKLRIVDPLDEYDAYVIQKKVKTRGLVSVNKIRKKKAIPNIYKNVSVALKQDKEREMLKKAE